MSKRSEVPAMKTRKVAKATMEEETYRDLPLVVDFDGTMQLTDVTKELLKWVLLKRFWAFPRLLGLYVRHRRAALKLALEEMVEKAEWIPEVPWEDTVLGRIVEEQAKGRQIVIVTGSTTRIVQRIMKAKGLDYEVVGTSDRKVNLTGPRKAAYLASRWGEKGFDYIGNSKDDFAVWAVSRYALVRGSSKKIRAGAAKVAEVVWMVDDRPKEKKAKLRRFGKLWHRNS